MRVRARRQRDRPTASWALLSRLSTGPIELADRDVYGQYRDQVLAHGPQAGRRPEAWWMFDVDVPARLRDGDNLDSVDEFDELEDERLRWLVESGHLEPHEIETIEEGARAFPFHPGYTRPAAVVRIARRHQ